MKNNSNSVSENQKRAHAYLINIRNTEISINNKELELEALRWKASGVGTIQYDKERVQSNSQNYMEMAIADCMELEQEIEEDRASIEEIKGTAYAIIRKLKKPEQRAIIEWFYLNCLSMSEIARKMFMSERNAYYLKDDALEKFGELIK